MDRKHRISIPPPWCTDGCDPVFLLLSRAHELPMLQVLGRESYGERMERISESDMSTPKKRRFLATLPMLSRQATLDDQGKLKIPKDLRGKAELARKDKVVLIGRGGYFEIWNYASFDTAREIEARELEQDPLRIF
jgi:DNA-binding transcriptional regulator/RsmH inhibitor MraZ